MALVKKEKDIRMSFLIDYLLKEKPLPFGYTKLLETLTNNFISEKKPKISTASKTIMTSLYDIPDYIKPIRIPELKTTQEMSTNLYDGYLINLSHYSSFDEYMKVKIRSARWSQLRRYKKRLDKCLRPRYTVYYGDNMTQQEYIKLFDTLKKMTNRRFEQKEELNFELPYLELYENVMYSLILKKKAGIFVIYHEDKPINITLNVFLDKICFHWNSCFDIDYGVFNLGHINVMNHLEWCFHHGFKIFDMCRGDFFHKRKWIDTTYKYQEYLIYDSRSTRASFFVKQKTFYNQFRYGLLQILKKLNLHILFGNYVRFKYRMLNKKKTEKVDPVVEKLNLNQLPQPNLLKTLHSHEIQEAGLLEHFNLFLHRSQEYVTNIQVYQEKVRRQIYYFKSEKNLQKITLNKLT